MPSIQDTIQKQFSPEHRGFLCALAVLSLYIFLFYFPPLYWSHDTFQLARDFGVLGYFKFSESGDLQFTLLRGVSPTSGLLVLITLLLGFGINYMIREDKKKLVQVVCSCIIIVLVEGYEALGLFLAGHFFVFSFFHLRLIGNMLKGTAHLSLLKMLVVQTPVVLVISVTLWNWHAGTSHSLNAGLLLFCWQWVRLMIYYMDDRDGFVPSHLSFIDYLSIFLCPGSVVDSDHGYYLGQGYRYVADRYAKENRDKVVLAGAKLLLVALVYFLFGPLINKLIVSGVHAVGVPVSTSVKKLVLRYVSGEKLNTAEILLTCIIGQINWFIFAAGIFHAKVGIWRLFGFAFDPQFNKPWLATNMVSLWGRYTFHFRTALLRFAYYPVFFSLRGRPPWFRISAATVASAGFANMFWAHIPRYLLFYGLTISSLEKMPTWPYYALLAFGILVAELYLLRAAKKRKPWSFGWGLIGDVAGMAVTISYFSLIHIYARPVVGGSLAIYTELFLKGLGISI